MQAEQPLNLDQLASLAHASDQVTGDCACGIAEYRGWTRVPATFPHTQLRAAGTLAGDPYAEPTYAEYHPHGSNYWSPDAPIAMRHFPYNRCKVEQCAVCGRSCLTYVEAGGYYVEPRIRALAGQIIVDVPADD